MISERWRETSSSRNGGPSAISTDRYNGNQSYSLIRIASPLQALGGRGVLGTSCREEEKNRLNRGAVDGFRERGRSRPEERDSNS